MKLSFTDFNEKPLNLDVDPDISILDLMIKVYQVTDLMNTIFIFNNSIEESVKLEIGKNINDYGISKTTLLKFLLLIKLKFQTIYIALFRDKYF